MPKEYFSHDYNSRNDRKIPALVKDYKSSGYGIFWCVCEMLHEEGGYLELDAMTIQAIAKDLNESPELIEEVINKCIFQYHLFTKEPKQIEAALEAESKQTKQKFLLQSSRVHRNLEERLRKSEIKAKSGHLGGIKSGESRRNKKTPEANGSTASSNEAKESKVKESIDSNTTNVVGNGNVIFDIEKYLQDHRREFEVICMNAKRSEDEVWTVVKKYHLSSQEKGYYPRLPLQLIAGVEKWLINEKQFLNGSHKQFSAGSNGEQLGTSAARIDRAKKF